MRIVLTRHPGQAGALEAELAEAGYDVGFLPLTEQRLPEETGELTRAIEQLGAGEYRWLVLTSANTVRALRRCGWNGGVPADTHTAVTGPGTARVLAELTSLPAPWMPSGEKSAEGILEEFPRAAGRSDGRRYGGWRLLLPQSAQARAELAAGLADLGWDVHRVLAYETVPHIGASAEAATRSLVPAGESVHALVPEELTAQDVLLISSSTAAEAYVGLRDAGGVGTSAAGDEAARTVAIGRPTAETLRRLGRPPDDVLQEPTAEGVRQILEAA